jgi:hypothetical protein
MAVSLAFLVVLGLVGGMLAIGRTNLHAEASLRGSDELFQHGVQARTDVDSSWEEIDRVPAPSTTGYAWVDRRAGIVSVPIGRAIDLVCAEQRNADHGREPPHSSP